MCNPQLAVMAVAMVMQAEGQRQEGKYNKQVADVNSKTAAMKEDIAIQAGASEEQRVRNNVSRTIGEQRAAVAGSGTAFDGTTNRLIEETVKYGEVDAQNAKLNSLREAWGFGMDRVSSEMQSKFIDTSTKNRMSSTVIEKGGDMYKYYRTWKGK